VRMARPRALMASFGKCGGAAPRFPLSAPATVGCMDSTVTVSLPSELVEALARRVAELLAQEPLAQRYLDPEEAARYTGIAVKTLRTRSWRERVGIPQIQLESGRLLFDKVALDAWLAPASGTAGAHLALARGAAEEG
jgi:Helix-turn-helix domain